MSVLDKATNQLADVLAAELALMGNLNKVRGHKAKLIEFIDMYRRFDAPEEPRPDGTQDEQAVSAEEPSQSAVVTPAAAESVAAEEPPSSSAPHSPETASDAGGFDSRSLTEIEVKPQVQVLPGVEDVKGGPTGMGRSDGGERPAAGEVTASPAPIPPSQVDTGAAGLSPADAPTSEAATREDAGTAAPETLKDRILKSHADHPDWNSSQIADHLGAKRTSVSAYCAILGIRFTKGGTPPAPRPVEPKVPGWADKIEALLKQHPDWTSVDLSAELGISVEHVNSAARKRSISIPRKPRGAVAVAEAREESSPPTPPPEPERPPAPSVPPPRAVDDDEIIPPEPRRITRPKGKLFWLRDTDGRYLDRFCSTLTRDRKAAWVGTEAQLAGCRRNFAIARDLREQVVEKEPARA